MMPYTIQQVIDIIMDEVHVAPLPATVDTVKAGDPSQPVTGIVTTFLASSEVLQKAADRGANLVISHEGPFYRHQDDNEWLADDPVYETKRRLIEAHKLVIWRFHDYWHRTNPDGVFTGMCQALGWADYVDAANPVVLNLPATTLQALVQHLKAKLGAQTVRVMGVPDMPCQQIALLVGFPGAERQIEALRQDIDVLVTGEGHEWETTEYVRDALFQGKPKAMIVLGHEISEEAGMAYLVDWLQARLPGVPITHITTGDPFRFE